LRKAFEDLTERGRARRLRALALNALENYDLKCQRLKLVTNHLNGIFRAETSGDPWILRVSTREGGHTRSHIEAETAWLSALARETCIPVPRPLPARDGNFVTSASAPGVPEERLCCVFSWVPGVDLASRLTRENIRSQGRLLAQLHEHTKGFRISEKMDILVFDEVFYFPEPVVIFDECTAEMMTPGQRRKFQNWNERAEIAIKLLDQSGEPARVLHGDLHQWNIRVSRGTLSPIDFEDLILGWPVQDIAISLYYYQDEKDYPAKRNAFREGYCSVSSWPERQVGEIDTFLAARGLSLLNFVLQNWKMLEMDPIEFSNRIEKRLDQLHKS
jgi:Ser/Thr protein kinase RdoA (MazF antagonist)